MGYVEAVALAIAGCAGLWPVACTLGDALARLADVLDRLEDDPAVDTSTTGRR